MKKLYGFTLTENHRRWARSASGRYRHGKQFWEDLISKQGGKCALTNVPLLFDSRNGTPHKGGPGVHPLYASVDHVCPGRNEELQILCYDINDLKAHLPSFLFNALKETREWKTFTNAWRQAAERSLRDRRKFKDLIKNCTPIVPASKGFHGD